jgi:DNA (cytosine-5)-methyltransferase 1
MKQKKYSLKFIDLFSGAGGLSCGLEYAGHKCLLAVDFDQDAINTFQHNHQNAETYCGDISKLTKSKMNKLIGDQTVDLIAGGPPCQGFSTAGKGNPLDERNSLFMQFVRIVKLLKPNYVLIENVTGMVAKKNKKHLEKIFKIFQNLGYNIDIKVISSELYGVPEKRRRTFIQGSKINHKLSFPKELPSLPVTVGEAFKDLKTKEGDILNHDLSEAKITKSIDLRRIKRIPEGKGIRYKKDERAYLTKSLYLGVDWDHVPENRLRQTRYQRLDSNQPSPTIMTHKQSYYHPFENRFLTIREAAKIQSFPNDFFFKGSSVSKWRQIGNAVPPLLAFHLGKELIKMYKNSSKYKINDVNKENKNVVQTLSNIRKAAFKYKQV